MDDMLDNFGEESAPRTKQVTRQVAPLIPAAIPKAQPPPKPKAPTAAPKTIRISFNELIAMQTADGFWQTGSLAKLQAFFKSPLPTHLSTEIICTIAALIVLEEFFSDQATKWQLIEKKAKDYLKKQGVNLLQELETMSSLV